MRMDWTTVQEWHTGTSAATAAAEVTCGDDLTVVRTAHGQLFSWYVSLALWARVPPRHIPSCSRQSTPVVSTDLIFHDEELDDPSEHITTVTTISARCPHPAASVLAVHFIAISRQHQSGRRYQCRRRL
jgi:hypothetical protein